METVKRRTQNNHEHLQGDSETSTQFVPGIRTPWTCAHQPPPDQRLLQEIYIIDYIDLYRDRAKNEQILARCSPP